ncbi:MAG: hypothetical protein GXP62_22260, partial [Oligoflexia bacterium]|nr:hypothetical protein [Oligoflexia bacterium]
MSRTPLAIFLIPLLATMACKNKPSNTGDDTGLTTTDTGTTTPTGTTGTST